jgi:hypothetical protein
LQGLVEAVDDVNAIPAAGKIILEQFTQIGVVFDD